MHKFIPQSKDLGLLVLRVGIGIMFIFHGLPKLMGGPEGWEGLAQYGLPLLPEGLISIIFGLFAVIAELGGGVLLVLGMYTRIACLALIATMAVAMTTHLGEVTGIGNFAKTLGWTIELIVVFTALLFTGPGRFAVHKSL